MALTLADTLPVTLADDAAGYSTPQYQKRRLQSDIEGTGEFGKGWASAGLSGQANSLWTQAAKAGDLDPERRATLEAQARDLDQQTAQWAPTVQNFTDVRGLRSGIDWAAGAMGNLRTSVAPAAAGLAGATVGGLAGSFTGPGGTLVGARAGGFAAASAAGYDTETDEAVASAMRDPYIRANHSYEEILAASRVKGGLNAMLEAAVPAVMGGRLLGTAGKTVLTKGVKPALGHVAKSVGEGAAGEFVTEGSQSLVGQGTQNYLQDKSVDAFDYKQAFNEGMAGAVAGGGMGVVGGVGQVAHSKLSAGVDKAKNIAADPLGATVYAVGKAKASLSDKLERALSPEVTPLAELLKGGDAVNTQRSAEAHALSVLQNPDASEQERADAVEFKDSVLKNPEGATNLYRDKLTIDHHENKQGKRYTDIVDEIKQRTEPQTRSSKMNAAWDKDAPIPQQMKASDRMAIESGERADQSQKQLETVADIWRKQGVDDKLLKATSDKTEGAQRTMAISVLGWVQRGMKDYDGNLFVPEALTRAYKDKSAKMIRKAVELAQGEGLITAEQAQSLSEVERMATAQHVEHNDLVSLVAAALKPSLRVKGVDSEQIRSILPDLTRIAVHGARGEGTTKGGTTRGQYGVSDERSATDKDALVALFGSEDNALPVLAKLYERAKGSKPELITGDEEAGATTKAGDVDQLDYEDQQGANEVGSKAPTFKGFGKDNVPYDTKDTYQKGYLAEHTAKGASNENKRSVGVWQRIKDQFANDPDALHDAETAILDEHAQDYLKPAQREAMEEYGVSAGTAVNEAPVLVRRAILGKIDQRFKLVRTEVMNDGDALAFTSEDMSALELKNVGFGKNSRGKEVVSTGKLILERAGVKTNYVTSAPMIVARMFGLKETATESNSENAAGSAAKRLDLLGQGLTSLLAIEGKFTGRVGYVKEAGGEVAWMKQGDLFPVELPLNGDKTMRVSDATKQRAEHLQKNEDEFAKVGLATTQIGMEKELRTLMDAPETSKKFAYVIKQAVEEGGKAVRDLYQDIRSNIKLDPNDLVAGNRHEQPQGSNVDREESARYGRAVAAKLPGGKLHGGVRPDERKNVNGTTGVGESDPSVSPGDIHTDDSVQGTLRASDPKVATRGDPAIQREDNGMAKGDAAGYHLTGSSRVNTSRDGRRVTESKARATGVESSTSPLATVKNDEKSLSSTPTETKALDKLESAKNWAVGLLSKGMPAFNKAVRTLDDKMLKTLETALGVISKLDPRAIREQFTEATTNAKANDISVWASVALRQLQGKIKTPTEGEVHDDTEGRSRVGAQARGRTVAERNDGEQAGGVEKNQGRIATVPDVGQAEGTGQAGKREAGVAAGEDAVSIERAGIQSAIDYLRTLKGEHDKEIGSLVNALKKHSDAQLVEYLKGTATWINLARRHVFELSTTKQNAQTPEGKQATQAERDAAAKHLTDTLGDTVERSFKPFFKDGSSGVWQKGDAKNIIRIALNSDVLGTAYHESMHELMSVLRKHGGDDVQQFMQRVATQGLVMKKLEQLLSKHPEALKQLADPEEAAAYMYQFWRAGMLKLGPQATTLFEKIKQVLAQIFNKVTAEIKDQQHAETIMAAFSSGAMKDGTVHEAAVKALMVDTARHEAALTRVGENYKKFADVAGKFVYSAEGMMESTKNKHIVELSTLFNQKAGSAMKSVAGVVGTFFDAVPRTRSQYMNKLENILQQPGIDKGDIELIREALATGAPSHLPRIQKIVEQMKAFNDELMQYAVSRDISKLDEKGQWVKMTKREDFGMPQVWDVEAVMKNPQALKDDLLATHLKELEGIAKKATAEAVSQLQDVQQKMGPAAKAAFDKAMTEFNASGKIMAPLNIEAVTPEMVADAIVSRIMNSGGHIGPHETTSNLGITPMAASVNKRSLSWVDPKVFDKYKQKDLINIYSSYVTSMTKRGEYTARFGSGGEKIRDLTDKAFLSEMGGDKLVDQTERELPLRVKQWGEARAAAMKAGNEFNTPYPTLRSVGSSVHSTAVGTDKFLEDAQTASKSLYQATRAVQAMEGTLGIDITPGMRTLNGILITMQSLRLLSTSLFTSMSDIVGIPLNGGEIGEAWDAFVRGMREVKLSAWDNGKSTDEAARRAELWGSVDAVSFNDAIGQGYGGMYLTGKAKHFSDTFFRKIGMEGWNRGMRISATMVGERIITEMARGKIDMSDKAAKARFERLFGAGATPDSIKLSTDGTLDINDTNNQAAISRFVNDSVMRPNAAQRTIWGSDPHYAALWHLKSFTWTQHKVIVEAIIEQAKLGNYRPAMVGLVGYTPVAIAAGAMKEMLIPGDEPPWMKGGLGSYLQYGFDRSGLGGIPMSLYGNLKDPASWFGPTVDQLQGIVSIPFLENHTVGQEALGSLPLGNILRRAAG